MLCDAIERNDLDEVRRLIEAGEDVDGIDFDHEATPIEKAAEQRNAEAVKLLLELGAAPDRAMINPPILLAATSGDLEIVGLLLANDANPNETDEDGFTALMGAAWKGHAATVEMLLGGGADPHQKSREGETAYFRASSDAIRALLPPD